MLIKNYVVLPAILSVAIDGLVVNTLGITHLHDKSLYNSAKWDILLIIQAADAFVEKNYKPGPFHASAFYLHAGALCYAPRAGHMEES